MGWADPESPECTTEKLQQQRLQVSEDVFDISYVVVVGTLVYLLVLLFFNTVTPKNEWVLVAFAQAGVWIVVRNALKGVTYDS